MDYSIHTEQVDSQHAAVVVDTVPMGGIGDFLGRAFDEVLTALARAGIAVDGLPFARYEMVDGSFRVEAGYPCPPDLDLDGAVHTITLPGGLAATTMHIGPYDGVAGAYQAIERWFASSGHRPTGAPWETYLDGPRADAPRTTVTWPCTVA